MGNCCKTSTSLPSVATSGDDGKTILNGTGAPSATVGSNGDFYIDTATQFMYGPKTSGSWPSGVDLNGAAGAAGTDGIDGTPLIHNDIIANAAHIGAVLTTLKSFTLPANQLENALDAVEISASFTMTGGYPKTIKPLVNSNNVAGTSGGLILVNGALPKAIVRMTLTRSSTTTVAIEWSWNGYTSGYVLTGGGGGFNLSLGVNDLTSLTNLIDFKGAASGTETIQCNQLQIKYLKKV